MRTRAEREGQALDIAAAVLVAALLWLAVVVIAAAVTALVGSVGASFRYVLFAALAGYVVTVVAWLASSLHRR
ncbi:hypothetical protein [Nocardioides sp.]|uniref:hypothetical protein n=1 Tax=Nocardioides sp. TaxID=35761 RepID=UPI0026287CD2|nr:hypothetical protein [Nocardioides sp.]